MNALIELLSNIFYMGINRSIIEVVFVSNNIFHEGFSLDHSFCILDEVFEYGKLGFREAYFFIIYEGYIILGIERDIPKGETLGTSIFSTFSTIICPLTNGTDSCYEFTGRKWFRNIIICS